MTRSQQAINVNLQLAIQPSRNGRHLASALHPSKPFFWLADTAWELPHRLDREEIELYLRNRAEKGFNVVMIVLFAEHGGLDYPNRDGNWPFDISSGTPDLFKPNEKYFEFVDWIVDTAASLGIITALVPTWGRYVNGGYYKGPFLFNDDNAFSFGQYVSNRYPFLPYILGGDSNRFWNAEYRDKVAQGEDIATLPLTDYGSITEAFARGLIQGEAPHIARLGVEYTTFITYHSAQVWLPQGPESTGSAQFPDASWLSLDTCQSGHYNTAWRPILPGDELDNGQTGSLVDDPKRLPHLWRAMSSYVPIRKMYATPRPDGHPRPVVDLEPHYENTHHWFRAGHPIWGADNIRRGAWQGIFAGACGYTYGANSIWQMHNDQSKTHPPIQPPTTAFTAWYLELDLAGAFQAATARRIVERLPNYFERIPDQSIILSDTREPAEGPADEALISGMRCSSGSWIAVYLPFGGDVTVNLLNISGSAWRAWWWDPRIGSREAFAQGGRDHSGEFHAPDRQDWILYIESL